MSRHTERTDPTDMKLLQVGYVLLAIAGIDFSVAGAGLMGYVSPKNEFLLIPIVFFGVVGCLLAGGYWLISLIWLFIAYEPDVRPVAPKKLRITFACLAALIIVNGAAHYLFHARSLEKSRITFNDSVITVQDSMLAFRQVCSTIDSTQFLSCYVHQLDSTLMIARSTANSDGPSNRLGHIDTVTAANPGLRILQPRDRARFLTLIRFLNRNHVNGLRHDPSNGFWLYSYRYEPTDDFHSTRNLYIYDTPADALHPAFRFHLRPIDKQQRIILVGFKDHSRQVAD